MKSGATSYSGALVVVLLLVSCAMLAASSSAASFSPAAARALTPEVGPPFVLPLVPGMNLLSLPRNPVQAEVDAVLGPLQAVNRVTTYDARLAGAVERADVDGSGCVEQGDVVLIAQGIGGQPGPLDRDVNRDGGVDLSDLALAGTYFGQGIADVEGPGVPPERPPRFCDGAWTGWLMAKRDPDTGVLEGNLKAIDAGHAYWVSAAAFSELQVNLPAPTALDPIPTVPVEAGWSLVPVLSLLPADRLMFGSERDADDYLGASWTVSFTFDGGRWASIRPGVDPDGDRATLDDAVQIGRGYWVFFTRDHTLTP